MSKKVKVIQAGLNCVVVIFSLRETPNAVKLRFLSVPTLKNTSNLVGE